MKATDSADSIGAFAFCSMLMKWFLYFSGTDSSVVAEHNAV